MRYYWDNLRNTPVLAKHHTHRHTLTWMHCGWTRATLVLHISAIPSRLNQSPNTSMLPSLHQCVLIRLIRLPWKLWRTSNLFGIQWSIYIFLNVRHVRTMSIWTHFVLHLYGQQVVLFLGCRHFRGSEWYKSNATSTRCVQGGVHQLCLRQN